MKKRKNSKSYLPHKSKVDTSLDKYENMILFPKKLEKAEKILAKVKLPAKLKRHILVP